MKTKRPITALAALVCALAALTPIPAAAEAAQPAQTAPAGTSFTWEFKPGEKFRYKYTQTMRVENKALIDGAERGTNQNMTVVLGGTAFFEGLNEGEASVRFRLKTVSIEDESATAARNREKNRQLESQPAMVDRFVLNETSIVPYPRVVSGQGYPVFLEQLFSLPPDPVEPGDTWEVAPPNVTTEVDVEQIKMTFRGIETYERRRCAVFEGRQINTPPAVDTGMKLLDEQVRIRSYFDVEAQRFVKVIKEVKGLLESTQTPQGSAQPVVVRTHNQTQTILELAPQAPADDAAGE